MKTKNYTNSKLRRVDRSYGASALYAAYNAIKNKEKNLNAYEEVTESPVQITVSYNGLNDIEDKHANSQCSCGIGLAGLPGLPGIDGKNGINKTKIKSYNNKIIIIIFNNYFLFKEMMEYKD